MSEVVHNSFGMAEKKILPVDVKSLSGTGLGYDIVNQHSADGEPISSKPLVAFSYSSTMSLNLSNPLSDLS